jgi:hypothetical protein
VPGQDRLVLTPASPQAQRLEVDVQRQAAWLDEPGRRVDGTLRKKSAASTLAT